MGNKKWKLSEEEYDKLNPPPPKYMCVNPEVWGNGDIYEMVIESPEWLLVGYIPTPKTKIE